MCLTEILFDLRGHLGLERRRRSVVLEERRGRDGVGAIPQCEVVDVSVHVRDPELVLATLVENDIRILHVLDRLGLDTDPAVGVGLEFQRRNVLPLVFGRVRIVLVGFLGDGFVTLVLVGYPLAVARPFGTAGGECDSGSRTDQPERRSARAWLGSGHQFRFVLETPEGAADIRGGSIIERQHETPSFLSTPA